MKITRVEDVPTKENPHGVDARLIYDQTDAQIVQLNLKPGESLKKHITPVDVAFYVLQGTGVVVIGEEEEEVSEETVVESPKGIPHLWRNEGAEELRVLVIKTPRPEQRTRPL